MFSRFVQVVISWFSSVFRAFESRNPKALIEHEKTNLRREILRFNQGLSEQAGFVYKLTRQGQEMADREKTLVSRIRLLVQTGDQDAAARLALQLHTLQKEGAEIRTRSRVAEETFRSLEKARDLAIAETTRRIERLEHLITETEVISAQNELLEMAKGMNVTLGFSHQSLELTREIIEESHQETMGKARLIRGSYDDLLPELALQEAEKKMLEQRALAEFLAVQGIPPAVEVPNPPVPVPSPIALRKEAAERRTL